MVEKWGRLGRKNGKRPSTTIRKAARNGCGRASPTCRRRSSIPTPFDVEELKQRFLVIQARWRPRAAWEEGVITDVREADVGSILGFGFAPFSGGTLSYIDMMGSQPFVALCRRLEKKHGARFRPGKLLQADGRQGRDLLWAVAPGRRAAA